MIIIVIFQEMSAFNDIFMNIKIVYVLLVGRLMKISNKLMGPASYHNSYYLNQRTNGPVNAHLRSAILTKYLF